MNRRRGFTLVELLVVIAIVGILVALILPAIQYAREAARRTSCMNNLKQVGLASIQHENVHRHYAARTDATDIRQGTWITAIMPYMEESVLHGQWKQSAGLTKGVTPVEPILQVIARPVATLYCPSRRPAAAYRAYFSGGFPGSFPPGPAAHTDYAINGGAANRADGFDVTWPGVWERLPTVWGVKRLRFTEIKDGLSKTYLVAEKSVSIDHYTSGLDVGDNGSIYFCPQGNCVRFAKRVATQDTVEADQKWSGHNFGSAHPSSFNAVFCDGSVHSLSYDISFATHAALASRAAGDKVVFP